MMSHRNIFIVGAAKAGTTTLYYLLSQHPKICAPVVKEPNYFSNLNHENDITGPGNGPGDARTVWTDSESAYHTLYKMKKQHRYQIDASVSYLYSRFAAKHIFQFNSDARIIIILRNPAERAWSHYKHLVRDNREQHTFEEALRREKERIEKGWEFSWHLQSMGLYSRQIERFYEYFSPEDVQIFLFEEIKSDIKNVVAQAASFSGLSDCEYNFEKKMHNVSGVPKSKKLSGLVSKIAGYKAAINKVIPPSVTHQLMQNFRAANTRKQQMVLAGETKNRLIDYFKEDIEKTQRLTGRNLQHWLH